MQDIYTFIQHHWTLGISLAVILCLLIVVELVRLKRGVFQVTPFILTQMINHKNALVVDLRPADDFAKGHIIGALSLPASEFKQNFKKLEKMKARALVLVCTKGLESPKIAAELKAKGFHVHVLRGGISGWISADMPLTKQKS